MDQLTLEQAAAARNIDQPGLRVGRHLTLTERYQEWRRTPDGEAVFAHVLGEARAAVEQGRRHYAIATLWEVARHHLNLTRGTAAGFKLNNDFRSLMAREVMAADPALEGFFETRSMSAA